MTRPLLALGALALAALPARAAAQDVTQVAACSAGTVGFVAKDSGERAQLDSAVASSDAAGGIQRIVELSEPGYKPQLRNASAVSRAMQRNFPSNTSALPQAASVMLLVRVDERGVVTHVSVHRDAPDQGFNAASMAVARAMRFQPAKFGECEVPFWTLLPISFQAQR